MPNIGSVLKSEITRLARKEVKSQLSGAKRAMAQSRRDIAALKRLVQSQQRQLASVGKTSPADEAADVDDESLSGIRFSARSVRAQRKRLGLSAEDYGRLVGVSGLTIYNWEQGKARPRNAQFAALVAVRGIGKRDALKRLAGNE